MEWTLSRISLFREVGLCLPRDKFARAEAHLAAGQVDAGCADALAALSIAVHTEYGHGLARVRRVAQAALPTNAARRLWAELLGVTPFTTLSSAHIAAMG